MKIQEIFSKIPLIDPTVSLELWKKNTEILGLAYDSRKVQKDFLFFAIPGLSEDGKKYIPSAFSKGACGVVVESLQGIEENFHDRCIIVNNIRESLAYASANFFQRPTKNMLVIGVTGTKGKTSATFLLDAIFSAAGKKTALLGTVECRYPGRKIKSERTTMESYDLQAFLRDALNAGAEVAILEVSSHALSLDRVAACDFDGVLFTNLMEDHLDFYGDMNSYFEAKLKLFTDFTTSKKNRNIRGISNADDSYGARVLREAKIFMKSIGLKNGDYSGAFLQASAIGIHGEIKLSTGVTIKVDSSLTGEFNIYNILGAAALADQMNIAPKFIENGIKNLTSISGRLERVESNLPFQVFVDFAHMGSALENVLRSLRPICTGKLMLVFGAGGDRPDARRAQLGQVAAQLADYSIITSDNPRTEDPLKIIQAVEEAFLAEIQKKKKSKNYEIEPDRKLAIEKVLRMAKSGDIVCIAGKGHETGQIIGTQVFPFDDREVAKSYLRELEAVHS